MEAAQLSDRISKALSLESPPVALTFVTEAPADVAPTTREVPSSCTFWREAEKGTFYASAAQHFNCPVGAMVMGFDMPEDVGSMLGQLVGGMVESSYLGGEEPPAIPTMGPGSQGIVYGPLSESKATPDVALMWLSPKQAMLASEASGAANWTSPAQTTTGRPGCGALPRSIQSGQPTLSLGCAGMRTFTEVADDRMLMAVPGAQLENFASALETVDTANDGMLTFYRGHKASFPSA